MNLIYDLDATKIPPRQQFYYVAMQSGGFSDCSFTKGDFYNMRRVGKHNLKSHDVDLLIQKLELLNKEDNNYYHSYVLDDEGTYRYTETFRK